ncbi:lysophospholipid acyltransferase family protein [Thioalkalivibrio sp. XN8]|uniref:lysophospholipid acyltransferase family protein n=1 Tax=Thioalkalivibrio sp. XN8 TaxID=2712863 RepID=UPI0013EC6D1C|nr:lysophospholipid acyltransferase family protein [Thioalkalivibrio sp. XN8]NGP52079.1 1-acyl-sn-glycerol-3-phosphate acyltransferase [Thioalkalivibrio sp. XN8]
MTWLRSLLYTTLLFLSVPVHATGVLLLSPFGHRAYYPVAVNWARVNLWLLRKICRLDFVVEGLENVPAEPCILYWKHESVFETMAGALVLPPQTWVVKRELMWLPFFGWGLALLKPIAINRAAGRTAVKQVISQGQERLRDGLCVVIYPEGTRVLPGRERRFGVSGAALAKAAGVPILPVAHNAGDYWPRRSFLKRPGTIRVVIGPPVHPDELSTDEITTRGREWILATMDRISPHRPSRRPAA